MWISFLVIVTKYRSFKKKYPEKKTLKEIFSERRSFKEALREIFAKIKGTRNSVHRGSETIIFGDRNGYYRQVAQAYKNGEIKELPEQLEEDKGKVLVSPSNGKGGRLIDIDTSRGSKMSALIITPPKNPKDAPEEDFDHTFDFERLPDTKPMREEWKVLLKEEEALYQKAYRAFNAINPYANPNNLEKYLQNLFGVRREQYQNALNELFKNYDDPQSGLILRRVKKAEENFERAKARVERERKRIDENIRKGRNHLGTGGWVVSRVRLKDWTIEHRQYLPKRAGDHFPGNKRQTEYPKGMGGHKVV